MTPEELRADIPALGRGIYLNFGAHGPSPRRVVRAAASFLRRHEFESPIDDNPYRTAFEQFDRSREAVASLIGARPDEIALTESTTAGINAIAGAIDWNRGDVIVRPDVEHPGGILPWQRLETMGVRTRVLETDRGRVAPDAFAEAVEGARLASFSAITWTHGTRLPVRELVSIAHENDALALVDAVQVPGQRGMDVSEWEADFVAASGHKWLLGPWGSGFLFVDRDIVDRLQPAAIGYRGVEVPTADAFELVAGAGRFEVGSANPAPHVGLEKAIECIRAVGTDTIEARIEELAARLIDGIPHKHLVSPPTPESGLVTIRVPEPARTVDRLRAANIIIRSVPGPNAIRASVHAVNTAEEIDTLIEELHAEW